MLKTISRLEYIAGEKVIHLMCDCDTPIVSVKEAIFQFLKYLGNIEDQVAAQKEEAEKKSAEEKIQIEAEKEECPSCESGGVCF